MFCGKREKENSVLDCTETRTCTYMHTHTHTHTHMQTNILRTLPWYKDDIASQATNRPLEFSFCEKPKHCGIFFVGILGSLFYKTVQLSYLGN